VGGSRITVTKVIFFGTPDYVLPVLDALKKEHEIAAVVTQPPKPFGRKKEFTLSPVAQWAAGHNIPVVTDLTLLRKSVTRTDIGVLAAYGRIIPQEVIDYFPNGIINVHPSILPKYRGASPVQAAIIAGDKETGATLIKMDKEVDHGPVIYQLFTEPVQENDTTGILRERLFKKSAEVLPTVLNDYLNGKITPKEQEHDKATFTTLIKKSDGFIPPKELAAASQGVTLQAQKLERFIRAMQPWPIAWTTLQDGRKLKILKAHIEDRKLTLDIVQLEGKNPVTWKQFKEGYPESSFQNSVKV